MKHTVKKILSTLLLLFVFAGALAGCSGGKQTTVSVKITSPDATIVDTTVTVTDDSPTASKAIIQACQADKIAYTVTDGLFDGFGGLTSTKEEGWLFYVNGVLSQTGAETTAVQEGDLVEFRYENYTQAFSSEPQADVFGSWRSETEADGSTAFLELTDEDASFTYIDSERTVTSYTGTYNIMNDEITINDLASNSPVKIPFEIQGSNLVITYNAKAITLTKQAEAE